MFGVLFFTYTNRAQISLPHNKYFNNRIKECLDYFKDEAMLEVEFLSNGDIFPVVSIINGYINVFFV